jgi:hypothetical protein
MPFRRIPLGQYFLDVRTVDREKSSPPEASLNRQKPIHYNLYIRAYAHYVMDHEKHR